jgi:hypothetical protein
MNSPDAILQHQLRRQSEPFDALWACRTKVSDGTYLTPLRNHALRVLRVVHSLSSSTAWDGVYHNLHQALSLKSVGLEVDVLGFNPWCYDLEDIAVSKVKQRFVAGQLIFQGAWNAFEVAGEALFLHGKTPTTQAVRHKLANGGHQPIFGLRESLFEAVHASRHQIDFRHAAFKEAVTAGNDLSIAAEVLRQFRNGVLHGKISNLKLRADWEPGAKDETCKNQTGLFHSQIRLVLFLLQAIVARVEANHEVYLTEGDLVKELIFAVQKEIPEDAVDHAGEEISSHNLFMDQKFIHDL